MASTPLRHMRIPDDEWDRLGEIAEQEGTDRTALTRGAIRALIESYE